MNSIPFAEAIAKQRVRYARRRARGFYSSIVEEKIDIMREFFFENEHCIYLFPILGESTGVSLHKED